MQTALEEHLAHLFCTPSGANCFLPAAQIYHYGVTSRPACAPVWGHPECILLWTETWHMCVAHHPAQLDHHSVQIAHHPAQLAHRSVQIAHHPAQLAHHSVKIAHHPVQIAAHLLLGKEHAAVAAERLQKQPELRTSPPALEPQHLSVAFSFYPSVLRH